METFKNGYFKLHFNKDMIVDGITCLTLEKYSLEMFRHIYGMSAVVLNNVHLKYTVSMYIQFRRLLFFYGICVCRQFWQCQVRKFFSEYKVTTTVRTIICGLHKWMWVLLRDRYNKNIMSYILPRSCNISMCLLA